MMTLIKRLALVGVTAGSLACLTTFVDTAQALPIASGASQTGVQSGIDTVRYRLYGHAGYGRRRAGVYRCGSHQLHTRLQRKACR